MFTPRQFAGPVVAVAAIVWTTAPGAQSSAQAGPGLGMPAPAGQVAAWDISIPPDGAGLPPGAGTAREGEELYATKCLACHGANGAGQPNDRLAGGRGTLNGPEPVKTVGSYWPYATTVFDYIRRAMPLQAPQSLTAGETYALTAYLLRLNGIISNDETIDATTLPKIVMPNRDNVFQAWGQPPAR